MSATMTGLDGTHAGSCVACLRGTDTGLMFVGVAEWVIAAMMNLGLPQQDATQMVETFCATEMGCDPGMVPTGDIALVVRVCKTCSSMPVGLIATGVPSYGAKR